MTKITVYTKHVVATEVDVEFPIYRQRDVSTSDFFTSTLYERVGPDTTVGVSMTENGNRTPQCEPLYDYTITVCLTVLSKTAESQLHYVLGTGAAALDKTEFDHILETALGHVASNV